MVSVFYFFHAEQNFKDLFLMRGTAAFVNLKKKKKSRI